MGEPRGWADDVVPVRRTGSMELVREGGLKYRILNIDRKTGMPTYRSQPAADASMADAQLRTERHQRSLDRFVEFWGEMASRWGINRTMAQIHAFLFANEEPVDTDTIMAQLGISRGNANMNLHSLLDWNLVRKVQRPGSRKDFYTAEKDVWELSARIVRERKRREVRPVREQLTACRAEVTAGNGSLTEEERRYCERLDSLIDLMDVFDGFTETIIPLIQQRNVPLIRQLVSFARTLGTPDEDAGDGPTR